MNIKEQIEIMQAYVTGEDIEVLADIGSWIGLPKNQHVEFNFQDFTYRIAKPKVDSLEDRVKAEYGDYEVVMLDRKQLNGILGYHPQFGFTGHTHAQSMRGFYRYVYQMPRAYILSSRQPTIEGSSATTILPIAVLFTKEK